MLIMIIITGVISNMKKYRKYSRVEDLKRIKGGYKPKRHFMSLYNVFLIFTVTKLFLHRSCKNFISGFFNYGGLHKKCAMNSFEIYDPPR